MSILPIGRVAVRGVLVCMLLGLPLATRAEAAALVIFDTCTNSSFCDEIDLVLTLQPGGDVGASLENTFVQRIVGFGINLTPETTLTLRDPGMVSLGPGDFGPFGSFTDRFETPPQFFNYLMRFTSASGRFSTDFDPFFENALGFFIAAQVLDTTTGETGFVAAQLVDASPVPEPGTMALLATGLVAAWRARRRTGQA